MPNNSATIQERIVKMIHRVEFNPFCRASAPIFFERKNNRMSSIMNMR